MEYVTNPGRGRAPVFFGWWVICAAILGLSIGPGQFAFGSLGLVMLPLQDEFGWNRAQISLALTIFTILLAFSMPVIGGLVDRFGSRRVLLPSVVIFAVLLASVSFAVSELWQLWLIFALMGSLAAGANSLPYLRTVSAWFDRRRGLAVGISMSGAGLGYFYVPLIMDHMTVNYGWRAAYYALAATALAVVPVLYFLFRNSPYEMGINPDGGDARAGAEKQCGEAGLSPAEVVREPLFWRLFLIFAVLSFSLFGMLPHLVPMLSDRGLDSSAAASVAALVGIASLVARAVNGYLIDRFFAPRVGFVCILLSAIGIAIFASGSVHYPLVLVAAILVGFGIGAEMDLLAVLTGRYFGLLHFGKIFGVLFISLLSGTSMGPVTFGLVYEGYGSYSVILTVCAVLTVCISLLTFRLPRFPSSAQEVPR